MAYQKEIIDVTRALYEHQWHRFLKEHCENVTEKKQILNRIKNSQTSFNEN